jgi:hypothetical protein
LRSCGAVCRASRGRSALPCVQSRRSGGARTGRRARSNGAARWLGNTSAFPGGRPQARRHSVRSDLSGARSRTVRCAVVLVSASSTTAPPISTASQASLKPNRSPRARSSSSPKTTMATRSARRCTRHPFQFPPRSGAARPAAARRDHRPHFAWGRGRDTPGVREPAERVAARGPPSSHFQLDPITPAVRRTWWDGHMHANSDRSR